MNLGRFQLGQFVKLGLPIVNGGGSPVAPDSAPTATITSPSNVTGAPFKLAMDGGPLAFSLPVQLGLSFALGTFSVSYTYKVNGVTFTSGDTFNVIAGGDPGGGIIAMSFYDRPEARYVVTQLTSGRIVQGRNPSL
jgi:hypothetical protein